MLNLQRKSVDGKDLLMARRPHAPLSLDSIAREAVALADEAGTAGLTMRALARRLGVEAMSLYHHVADKRALLEAAAERVWGEVGTDAGTLEPFDAVRRIATDAHRSLLAHSWVLEVASSAGGRARLGVIEALLTQLQRAGLSDEARYESYHLIDALVLGYTAQEASYRGGPDAALVEQLADYPQVQQHARAHAQPHPSTSGFAAGLDLVLAGLTPSPR
ncbi:MAG: hypothetical protein DI534_09730 [Leifsonia xyli]|nr:MAG: hypothetical protein DI534_09730 [Leifsonia xyli]